MCRFFFLLLLIHLLLFCPYIYIFFLYILTLFIVSCICNNTFADMCTLFLYQTFEHFYLFIFCVFDIQIETHFGRITHSTLLNYTDIITNNAIVQFTFYLKPFFLLLFIHKICSLAKLCYDFIGIFFSSFYRSFHYFK